MTVNEGPIDRGTRVIIGLALISIVFVGPQSPLGWVGIWPLATGLLGHCPLYALLGVNTCRAPEKKD